MGRALKSIFNVVTSAIQQEAKAPLVKKRSKFSLLVSILAWLGSVDNIAAAVMAMILAGDETGLPIDTPSVRLDTDGSESPYSFVGALTIQSSGTGYRGTGAALSPHWVLTAGHNVDLNDDGLADPGLGITFHLSGDNRTWSASTFYPHPSFSGFGNPTVRHDLALLYFAEPLPEQSGYALLGAELSIGTGISLAGYGRSGYGSYGYTTNSSLTDRRVGENAIDSLEAGPDGQPLLFRYIFSEPSDPTSLGNDRESIIGPGDSGGPLLVLVNGQWRIAGINTFTEGYGGRFGDIGGGVVLAPYLDWIYTTTGIPEPVGPGYIILGALIGCRRKRW